MLYTLFTKPLSKIKCQLKAYGLVMSRTKSLYQGIQTNTCYCIENENLTTMAGVEIRQICIAG